MRRTCFLCTHGAKQSGLAHAVCAQSAEHTGSSAQGVATHNDLFVWDLPNLFETKHPSLVQEKLWKAQANACLMLCRESILFKRSEDRAPLVDPHRPTHFSGTRFWAVSFWGHISREATFSGKNASHADARPSHTIATATIENTFLHKWTCGTRVDKPSRGPAFERLWHAKHKPPPVD